MNERLKITAICSMAVILTLGMAAMAECGVIHHKTTVYNKSDKDVQVFLHYGFGGSNRKDQYIKAISSLSAASMLPDLSPLKPQQC